MLNSLGRWVAVHRRVVVIAWICAVVVAGPLAARQNAHLSNGGFVAPGSGSAQVDSSLKRFPGYDGHALAVVLSTSKQTGTAPVMLASLQHAAAVVRAIPGLSVTPSALTRAREEAVLLPVAVLAIKTATSEDIQDNAAVTLRQRLNPGTPASNGVTTYLAGQAALWAALDDLSKRDLTRGEKVGFPVVLIILLGVFGSFAAASLPLILGMGSVVLSGAAIYLLSRVTPVSIFATNIASMLGIGVAVDYSLFMLARYQRELRAGADRDAALRTAMRTSGYAILISGLTVFAALIGLLLVNSTVVRSMAVGAIMVVIIAVLGALTLTPVLMRRFGNRYSPEERFVGRVRKLLTRRTKTRVGATPTTDSSVSSFWSRWAGRVMARPIVALSGCLAILIVLAVPALSVRIDNAALNQFPAHNDARRGVSVLTETFGAGVTGPLQVLVQMSRTASPKDTEADLRQVEALLRSHPDLRTPKRYVSRNGHEYLFSAIPKLAPDSAPIHRLVNQTRRELAAARLPGAHTAVGGTTAETQDYNDDVAGSLWKVALFIAVATAILLVFLLRSVVLAIKAVLMTALTVMASYGVLVAVFQWRWLDPVVPFGGPGYLGTLTPPFVLAMTFGLSMDYQVFLLTRIRERYMAGASNAEAVEQGLASSASVISSAALIMVSVFAVFAATSVPSVREVGLGLGVAIALDATLVRLILVPAAMQLLGRWNWWYPRVLAGRKTWVPAAESAPAMAED